MYLFTWNLSLVEYNCVPRTDRYKIESMVILTELLKDAQAASILGTEHQIHCVAQVIEPRSSSVSFCLNM